MSTNIDQKSREELLNKLSALLGKTEQNGCTEGEARVAAGKAQQLMDKYGLSLADLTAASPTDVCGWESVFTGRKKTHEVQFCGPTIAEFTGTKVWLVRGRDEVRVQFFGIKNDVSVAVYLFKTFRSAMDFEWTRYWSKNTGLIDVNARTARKSFMQGMYRRLCERLREEIDKREAVAASNNGCREIVVAKEKVVAEAFDDLGLRIGAGRRPSISERHHGSYRAGSEAGNRVSITQGALE
jgi:Protein of unknown function (DUF2786)